MLVILSCYGWQLDMFLLICIFMHIHEPVYFNQDEGVEMFLHLHFFLVFSFSDIKQFMVQHQFILMVKKEINRKTIKINK